MKNAPGVHSMGRCWWAVESRRYAGSGLLLEQHSLHLVESAGNF
jgi:hypothetical protein